MRPKFLAEWGRRRLRGSEPNAAPDPARMSAFPLYRSPLRAGQVSSTVRHLSESLDRSQNRWRFR